MWARPDYQTQVSQSFFPVALPDLWSGLVPTLRKQSAQRAGNRADVHRELDSLAGAGPTLLKVNEAPIVASSQEEILATPRETPLPEDRRNQPEELFEGLVWLHWLPQSVSIGFG